MGRLRSGVRDHIERLNAIDLANWHLLVVAGSSVYLSAFVLEVLLDPGGVLVLPEYSFYGTMNAILPLFSSLDERPDCGVSLLPAGPAEGCRLTAATRDRHMSRCPAVQRIRREASGGFRQGASTPGAAGRVNTVLWLTCPTTLGAVYSRDELSEIARVAKNHGLAVVCDEIFAGLGNFGDHLSPAAVDAFEDRFLCIGTTLKGFNFYDGDHVVETELADLGDIFTEDINTFAGAISYCYSRNGAWLADVAEAMENHPFTVTRATFAAELVTRTGQAYFAALSEQYRRDREHALAALSALIAEINRSPAGQARSVLQLMCEPSAGYLVGFTIDRSVAAAFGIQDAAEFAAFLTCFVGVSLDVATGARPLAPIALRFNCSKPLATIDEAVARIRGNLGAAAAGGFGGAKHY